MLNHGLISSYERGSDMRFDVTAAAPGGGAWRTARESFSDATSLVSAIHPVESGTADTIQEFLNRMLSSANIVDDPRLPFDEKASESNFLQNFDGYDAAIADMLSPVFFHYAFETLRPAMMGGFLVDAQIEWRHGGWIYDGSPRAFGFVDDKVNFFSPQTQALCLASFYASEKRRLRRYLAYGGDSAMRATTDGFASSIETVTRSLTKAQSYAPLAFCNDHVDRWVLMPSAVISLVKAISDAIWETKRHGVEALDPSFMSSHLDLRCDPYHRAFLPREDQEPSRRIPVSAAENKTATDALTAQGSTGEDAKRSENPMIDARGQYVRAISLIQNGAWAEFPKSDVEISRMKSPGRAPNGRAVDETGEVSRVFCPVLSSASGDADERASSTGEDLSQSMRGKICCIERLGAYVSPCGEIRVVVPNGGVLFQDGDCLGHTTAPLREFAISDFLGKAQAISAPQRIGGIAAATLEVEPNL